MSNNKKKLIVFIKITVILFTFYTITSCNWFGDISSSDYSGDITVDSFEFTDSESFTGKIFGNMLGQFTPRYSPVSREVSSDSVLAIPDLLKRYEGREYVERFSYSFTSFKLVTDIMLKPKDYYNSEQRRLGDPLITWGGEVSDQSQYIDLVTGALVTTDDNTNLYQTIYNSIILQINAPAETIVPDFGEDNYNKINFSWGDLKPFYSTDSSAQHVLLSTFVTKPFVKWIEGPLPGGFNELATVVDYNNRNDRDLVDFGDWAFNAVINQEFFDELAKVTYTEDPNSGEAWIFLPLYDEIDLTDIDNVSFSFEFFMKDLMEVYIDALGTPTYVLSSGKKYIDQNEREYFGPLPIAVSYAENPNGFAVDPIE